ncbi:MAG: hypothetical protein ACQERJ_09190, partial [Bacillota bacterium]
FVIQTDLQTNHWNGNYNNNPNLIAAEYHVPDSHFYGIAHFKNSFSQSSWYFYSGQTYNLYQLQDIQLHCKLTYGIVHGYNDEDGEYDGFINRLNTFPVILPSIGMNYNNFIIELIPLANSGFAVISGVRF